MRRFVLISCVSMKLERPAPAGQLYVSPLFRMNLAYARSLTPDGIFILSAKYGLLSLGQVVEPYDLTLNTMNRAARREWASKVATTLQDKVVGSLDDDEFTFLAGANYREYLVPLMRHVRIPMEGLGIGRQLEFLKQRIGTLEATT